MYYLEAGQKWIPKDPTIPTRTILKFPYMRGITYLSIGKKSMTREVKRHDFDIWIRKSEATLHVEDDLRIVVIPEPIKKAQFRLGM